MYDEAVTLTRHRTNSVDAATRLGERLREVSEYPTVYALEHVSVAVFQAAVRTLERYDDRAVSFTDATTIALLDRLDLDRVLRFDNDFDGIVPRVEPTTVS